MKRTGTVTDEPDNETLVARMTAILKVLLKEAGASRTTVRVDLPARGWSVNTPCAETLAPGMMTMMNDASVDHRRARSLRWIEKNRKTLIQEDSLNAGEAAPPPELIKLFGARAQMIGPLIGADDYLVGWISCHFADGPRQFSKAEQDALVEARRAVSGLLGLPFKE